MLRRALLPGVHTAITAVLLLSAPVRAQQRTADKTFWTLTSVRAVAGACDVISTRQALRYPGARDVSPFAWGHPSALRLSLIKAGLIGFQGYASWRAKRDRTRIPWWTPLVVNSGLDSGLAAHNWALHPPRPGGVR